MGKTKDTTSRVTVYRLATKLDLKKAEVTNYDKVGSGTEKASGFKYSLWFGTFGNYTPNWYPPFKGVASKTPKAKQSGFVLLVNTSDATYGCTGGLGYHKLVECFDIEPRFGITLAKKIITTVHLKGLVQKDASGIVNSLDRVFRGTYNPQGDIDNLHRVLTNLRASFPRDNSNYADIGASIRAGDSLTANGAKDFAGIVAFIKKADELWQSNQKGLAIPELEHISPKHSSALIGKLHQELIEEIKRFPKDDTNVEHPNLFLDNIGVGYLPDRVVDYTVSYKRDRSTWPGYRDVFAKMAEIITEIEKGSASVIEEVKSIKIQLKFDDDFQSKAKSVLHYICGDVVLDGEAYFIYNGLWYRANEDYIKKINAELDEVRYLPPNELGLQAWSANENEDAYNTKHASATLVVLDRRLVRIQQEKGPIEFCDLLDASNANGINLIHVKNACGAELRALFAQGYVSAQLYSQSDEFRDNVHAAQVDGTDNLSDADKKVLATLKGKRRENFRIVYAIYDDKSAHPPTNASGTKVTEVLSGTLTLFANVDLLFRVQGIQGLGYHVTLTRIKPYPDKN